MSDRKHELRSVLTLLSLVCLAAIHSVDAKFTGDIESYRRTVEGAPPDLWLRGDGKGQRAVRSPVNSAHEVDARKPEYFFNYDAFEDQGLPEKFLVGNRTSFSFFCPRPDVKPFMIPCSSRGKCACGRCVKLTENRLLHHRYLVEITDEFTEEPCFGIDYVVLTCMNEYKTPEYYHRNVSYLEMPLVYAPMNPKVKLAQVANPPAVCGSKRVKCSVQANPPANWTLKRVILDETDKVSSYEALNVSDGCVSRDSANSTATFSTELFGHLACAATNEYGSYIVRFYVHDTTYDSLYAFAIGVFFGVICFAAFYLGYVIGDCCFKLVKTLLRKSETDGNYPDLEQTVKEKSVATKFTATDKDTV